MFCVDVSLSMAQPGRHGDSHLETSLKVMNQIVQQKVLHVLCGREAPPTWWEGLTLPPPICTTTIVAGQVLPAIL